jgi:hypothetical protein
MKPQLDERSAAYLSQPDPARVPLEQPEPPEPPEPPTDWAAMLALITDLQRRLGEMDDEGHAVYASLDALREMIEAAE